MAVPTTERAEPVAQVTIRNGKMKICQREWGCSTWPWSAANGLLVAVLMLGCKSKTETGYEPRRLGDSLTVQRGYYAAPFTPEAREAQTERQGDIDRRPDLSRTGRPY